MAVVRTDSREEVSGAQDTIGDMMSVGPGVKNAVASTMEVAERASDQRAGLVVLRARDTEDCHVTNVLSITQV